MMRRKRGKKTPDSLGGRAKKESPDYSSAVIPALVLILMTLIVLFVQSHAGKGMV